MLVSFIGTSQSIYIDLSEFIVESGDLVSCEGFIVMNDSSDIAVIQVDSIYYNKFKITERYFGNFNDVVFKLVSILDDDKGHEYSLFFRKNAAYFNEISHGDRLITLVYASD